MRSRALIVRLVILVIAVVISACSGGDVAERLAEGQEGVDNVDIDESSGQVDVDTDDGSFSIGGGDLPDDFPVDLPSGGDFVATGETELQATVVVTYPGASFQELSSFFEDWISESGLTILQNIDVSEPPAKAWTLEYQESGAITINVTDNGDDIIVQVTVVNG